MKPTKITFSIPFSKVDEEQRMVYGIATAEVLDKQNEIVDYEASKKAFSTWKGNIREMHQDRAVGKSIDIQYDDNNKAVVLGAYISKSPDGENAWTKIKEGILTGFSIAGSVFSKVSDTAKSADGVEIPCTRIMGYDLAETSVVDSPACPVAEFVMIKNTGSGLDQVEKMVIHKVPVNNPWWLKGFGYTSDQVMQKAEPVDNKVEMAKKHTKKVVEAEPVKETTDVEPSDTQNQDTSHDGEESPQGAQDISGDQGKDDSGTTQEEGIDEKSAKPDMKKDLYSVGSLADALQMVVSIRDWCVMENEWEEDNSLIPARLTDAIDNLGGILTDMAQEESQEAATVENSQSAADLQKTLEAAVTKATTTALESASELFTGKVETLIKPLTDRVEALEHQPAVASRPAPSYFEVEKGGLPVMSKGTDKTDLKKRWDELKAEATRRKYEPLTTFPLNDRQKLVNEMWKLNKQLTGNTIAELDPLALK